MKASWIIATAAVASLHLATDGPLAAATLAAGFKHQELARPVPNLILVQGAGPAGDVELRITRLLRNREIIENALGPSRQSLPAVPPLPRARALQPPEPELSVDPEEPALAPEPAMTAEAEPAMSCDSAAAIVAEYGFSDVREEDCSSDLYRFSAVRDGAAYSIGITAATGEIAEVSRE
jgi:hypothetical protein